MPISNLLSKTALVLVLLIAGPAFAVEDERDFQEHYQRAMLLYRRNILRGALREFTAAYALNPLPRLLYNMGQLQRKCGDYRDAIESYELYLRTETDLPAERRTEVEGYIDSMRAGLGSASAPGDAATGPGKSPGAPVAPAGPAGSGPAGSRIDLKKDAAASSSPPLLLILPPESAGKAGRLMFNMGVGFAIPFIDLSFVGTGGLTVRPELGIAVNKNRNAYILISPQVQIIKEVYQVLITVGFQYDFPVLVRGLFLVLRGNAGYDVAVTTENDVTLIHHYGIVIPELGLKYIVNSKYNFGCDPLSLPLTFKSGAVQASYRSMFYAGFNF